MRYFESIEIARKILDKKRVDIDIFLNMCICLGKIGKYSDALEYYNKILKINKNYKKSTLHLLINNNAYH